MQANRDKRANTYSMTFDFYHADRTGQSFSNKQTSTQQGRYYTPKLLADICHKMLAPHTLSQTIFLDNSAGYGSFVKEKLLYRSILAEKDTSAIDILKKKYPGCRKILHENALLNVSRSKYGLTAAHHLAIIGNPPYNDRTSKNKKNQKQHQTFITDADLRKRDLGMSFLLSYAKLDAAAICVLHPLSYLIKPTNFAALSDFYAKYRLLEGVVFSSHLFNGTQSTAFPIVAALYKSGASTDYDQIKNFRFKVLSDRSKQELVVKRLETIDGYIRKYPPRSTDIHKSDIGLYFYNFRDANSLFTSANFTEKVDFQKHITVNQCNFYKYAYLSCYKRYFPRDYVFGNFSPLVQKDILENSAVFKAKIMLDSVLNNPRIGLFQTDSFRKLIKKEILQLLLADSTPTSKQIKQDIRHDGRIPANIYESDIKRYFQNMLIQLHQQATNLFF